MGWGAILEAVNVGLDSVDGDATGERPLHQEVRVVNPLSPRDDFLPSDKDVVRVAVEGVVGAGHGVKGSSGLRVSVEDEKVRPVLLLDEGAYQGVRD